MRGSDPSGVVGPAGSPVSRRTGTRGQETAVVDLAARDALRHAQNRVTIRPLSASGTLAADDGQLLIDSTSGARTITLVDAATYVGLTYAFKQVVGGNAITLQPVNGQLIDGAATLVFNTVGLNVSLRAALFPDGSYGWMRE